MERLPIARWVVLVAVGLVGASAVAEQGCSCTPEKPLGATMVSTEGACAAYYRYRRVAPGEV